VRHLRTRYEALAVLLSFLYGQAYLQGVLDGILIYLESNHVHAVLQIPDGLTFLACKAAPPLAGPAFVAVDNDLLLIRLVIRHVGIGSCRA